MGKDVEYCDNCGDVLIEGTAQVFTVLPFNVESANKGESGVLCARCVLMKTGENMPSVCDCTECKHVIPCHKTAAKRNYVICEKFETLYPEDDTDETPCVPDVVEEVPDVFVLCNGFDKERCADCPCGKEHEGNESCCKMQYCEAVEKEVACVVVN